LQFDTTYTQFQTYEDDVYAQGDYFYAQGVYALGGEPVELVDFSEKKKNYKNKENTPYSGITFTGDFGSSYIQNVNSKNNEFIEKKKAYINDPNNDNYDAMETAMNNVINALKTLSAAAKVTSTDDDTKKILNDIVANSSKGKTLDTGEYYIVELDNGSEWNNLQNIKITIRKTYDFNRSGLELIVDSAEDVYGNAVDNSNLPGPFEWDYDNEVYVLKSDKTKYIKFTIFETDGNSKIIRASVIKNDNFENSLVTLIKSKKSKFLEDNKRYNIKITANNTDEISSIPKYYNQTNGEYEFTIHSYNNNNRSGFYFYNSNLKKFHEFSENMFFYYSSNDSELDIDFFDDGTLVLVKTKTNTDTHNVSDTTFIGTYEEVPSVDIKDYGLYKNGDKYFYIPYYSNQLFLIAFENEDQLNDKIINIENNIIHDESYSIYQFHADKGEYINHQDGTSYQFSQEYQEQEITYTLFYDQTYYDISIPSKFKDYALYDINLKNQGTHPGWFWNKTDDLQLIWFFDKFFDTSFYDNLTEWPHTFTVEFDIIDKSGNTKDSVKFNIKVIKQQLQKKLNDGEYNVFWWNSFYEGSSAANDYQFDNDTVATTNVDQSPYTINQNVNVATQNDVQTLQLMTDECLIHLIVI